MFSVTNESYFAIITVRNSSCGKVMFSQVSVRPQGGGVHPLGRPPRQTPIGTSPWADTPPRADTFRSYFDEPKILRCLGCFGDLNNDIDSKCFFFGFFSLFLWKCFSVPDEIWNEWFKIIN